MNDEVTKLLSDWQEKRVRVTEGEKRRGLKVSEGEERAGPRRWSDRETAICCHSSEVRSFSLCELLPWWTQAASHSYIQSKSEHILLSVLCLHSPPAVTHPLILGVSPCLLSQLSVVLQSRLAVQSCRYLSFCRLAHRKISNELLSHWCTTRLPLENKTMRCLTRNSSATAKVSWKKS